MKLNTTQPNSVQLETPCSPHSIVGNYLINWAALEGAINKYQNEDRLQNVDHQTILQKNELLE